MKRQHYILKGFHILNETESMPGNQGEALKALAFCQEPLKCTFIAVKAMGIIPIPQMFSSAPHAFSHSLSLTHCCAENTEFMEPLKIIHAQL